MPSVYWPSIPHWLLPVADVDISIKNLIKEGSVGNVANYVQEHLRNLWNSYIDIYTDGSRNPESKKVGFGLYVPYFHVRQCHRLPDGLSIFTAELVAIIWALRWVEEGGVEKAIICSDSLSGLMAIGGERGGARLDLVGEILTSVYRLERRGCSVGFLWVPAHVGVEGNEAADEAARASLVRGNVEVPFDRLECRSIINERLTQQWQHEWSKDISGRKFYDIKPLVNPGNSIILPRMDQIKLARLRLGHCGLASGLFLVGKHMDGKCQACGVQESVKHVIMFCPRYAEERRLLFIGLNVLGVDLVSVKTLMGDGPNQIERALELLHFLKATGIYWKI